MNAVRLGRRLAAVAILAGLGACSILPEPVVRTAYILPSTQTAEQATALQNLPAAPWRLRVVTPQTIRTLDSRQLWVVNRDASVGAYKDVLWSDPLPSLLRERLITTFIDSGRIESVSSELTVLPSDFELDSDLRVLQVERRADGDYVFLRLDANLLHLNTRKLIAERVFEQRIKVADMQASSLVQVYGEAIDRLSADLLAWVIAQGNASGLAQVSAAR